MKTHFTLAALMLLFFGRTPAQVLYDFEATTGTYTDLVNATAFTSNEFILGGEFYLLPLDGETFNFFATEFPMGGLKTFAMQPNGNLRIDDDTSLMIIDAAFTYFDSIDPTSTWSYLIEGSNNNKVVKAQWKNFKLRVGPAGNFANIQIWVYQATGVMEIHYGPRSANNATGYNQTSGPQVGIFHSKDDFTALYGKLWVKGSPDNLIIDSAFNYQFRAMSGVPEEGTVFRFIPRFIQQPPNGINNTERNEIKVYPNPVNDVLFIDGINTVTPFEVMDISGKVMLQQTTSSAVNVSSLAPGTYFIKAGSNNRFVYYRFLKQ
jgi:hypothetical protein